MARYGSPLERALTAKGFPATKEYTLGQMSDNFAEIHRAETASYVAHLAGISRPASRPLTRASSGPGLGGSLGGGLGLGGSLGSRLRSNSLTGAISRRASSVTSALGLRRPSASAATAEPE